MSIDPIKILSPLLLVFFQKHFFLPAAAAKLKSKQSSHHLSDFRDQ
jgi:hypothetical protein